jgi:hypothetical protein
MAPPSSKTRGGKSLKPGKTPRNQHNDPTTAPTVTTMPTVMTPATIAPTPSRKSTRGEFKSFGGTAHDEQRMLRHAIIHILNDKTKYGRNWIASSIYNKTKLKVMNEDRSVEDLRNDIKRISSDMHVTQHPDNPSKLKYSRDFLDEFQDPTTPACSKDDDSETPNSSEVSPNLLEDDSTARHTETEIKDTTPPSYHPVPSQITPTIQNLESAMKIAPFQKMTPSAALATPGHAKELFPTETVRETVRTRLSQTDTIEEQDDLDNDSLATGNNPSIGTQKTKEQDDDNSIDTAQRIIDFQMTEHITNMMNKIISQDGSPIIKNLIEKALNDRLHDESLDTELDDKYQSIAQQIDIASSMDTRLETKIETAASIEKLLDKRTDKAKQEYTEIKANEKELEKRNKELKASITKVNKTLRETNTLHAAVIKNQADHLALIQEHYADFTKKIDSDYKRLSTDIEDMAKNSQIKSLAKFEETYQKRLTEINTSRLQAYKENCTHTTTTQAATLKRKVDQQVKYIKTNTDEVEELFQSFVNQAPMDAQRDIQYALEDCIEETIEKLEKEKNKVIATWNTTFADTKNHSIIRDNIINDAQDAIEQTLRATSKDIKRNLTPALDAMFAERKATFHEELQQFRLDMQQTTKTQTDQHKQHLESARTTIERELDQRMETMLREETGDRDSTLQTNVALAIAEATEQMVTIRDRVIQDIHNERTGFSTGQSRPTAHLQNRYDNRNRTYPDTQDTSTRFNPNKQDTDNKDTETPPARPEATTYDPGQDPRFPSPRKQDEPPIDLDNRHWQSNVLQLKRSSSVTSNLPRFTKEIIQHNLRPDPRQDQLESFYDTLVTSLESYEIPILRRQDLRPRGNTKPSERLVNEQVESTASRVIYNKLLETIPDECTTLREIIGSYASEQDGYAALYSIMRTKCRYLQDLLPKWGPIWLANTTAYQYLAQLKSSLEEAQRTSKQYTTFEIAAEILQQAKQHAEYHLIATSYLTRLLSYTNHRHDIPSEYRYDNLICTLETNKDLGAAHPTIPINPKINRFNGNGNGREGRDNSSPRQPFNYRNPVQCKACKTFGHCIGANVCRFSAQCHFATEYNGKEPIEAKANATAFATANNKNKINKIKLLHPTAFTEDMTPEDDDYILCMLARVMQDNTEEE